MSEGTLYSGLIIDKGTLYSDLYIDDGGAAVLCPVLHVRAVSIPRMRALYQESFNPVLFTNHPVTAGLCPHLSPSRYAIADIALLENGMKG